MFAQCIPLESESETKPLIDSFLNEMLVLKLFLYGLLNNNLLLTEREGRTGEYWPEVVAVRTELSEVRTRT